MLKNIFEILFSRETELIWFSFISFFKKRFSFVRKIETKRNCRINDCASLFLIFRYVFIKKQANHSHVFHDLARTEERGQLALIEFFFRQGWRLTLIQSRVDCEKLKISAWLKKHEEQTKDGHRSSKWKSWTNWLFLEVSQIWRKILAEAWVRDLLSLCDILWIGLREKEILKVTFAKCSNGSVFRNNWITNSMLSSTFYFEFIFIRSFSHKLSNKDAREFWFLSSAFT